MRLIKRPKLNNGNILCRSFCAIMCIVLLCQTMSLEVVAKENNKKLTRKQADALILAESPKIESIEGKINTKEASLKQAIKSIQLKRKNMSSFRYTPLLSFKFPEQPDLSDEYEFEYKPIQIQGQIDVLKHSLNDQKIEEYKKVNDYFVDIVSLQEKIDFNENRADSIEETLKKNKARFLLGEAKESDIQTLESNLSAINNAIISDRRSLEATKKKLSNSLGLDVTTGYEFENPFIEAEIPRSVLDKLIQYTLDNDQTYYQVCSDATLARVTLETDYKLISKQYSSKNMSIIKGYVDQARNGQKISSRAFKSAYETFLKAIDAPWQGDYKIKLLFITIKFPKEWFKGEIDGVRYIEDEPYALYEAALEYQDARLEKENTELELTNTVTDTFNSYISMRNAYLSYTSQVEAAAEQLKKDQVLNRVGELTFEEYKSTLDSYEELEMNMLTALKDYSDILYSFDRLTCGAVTAYLDQTSTDLFSVGGGISRVDEEITDGAYYYINPIAQQEAFELSIYIPEDYNCPITHFELWCDNIQIGERTEIDKTLRHLTLSKEQLDIAKIRFYQGEEFVSDCEIDPYVNSGPLPVITSYNVTSSENGKVGTYTAVPDESTGLVTLKFSPNPEEKIAYIKLFTKEGSKPLGTGDYLDIKKGYSYLAILSDSLEDIEIQYFDSSKKLLYKGYFNTVNLSLMKDLDE